MYQLLGILIFIWKLRFYHWKHISAVFLEVSGSLYSPEKASAEIHVWETELACQLSSQWWSGVSWRKRLPQLATQSHNVGSLEKTTQFRQWQSALCTLCKGEAPKGQEFDQINSVYCFDRDILRWTCFPLQMHGDEEHGDSQHCLVPRKAVAAPSPSYRLCKRQQWERQTGLGSNHGASSLVSRTPGRCHRTHPENSGPGCILLGTEGGEQPRAHTCPVTWVPHNWRAPAQSLFHSFQDIQDVLPKNCLYTFHNKHTVFGIFKN